MRLRPIADLEKVHDQDRGKERLWTTAWTGLIGRKFRHRSMAELLATCKG